MLVHVSRRLAESGAVSLFGNFLVELLLFVHKLLQGIEKQREIYVHINDSYFES